MLQDGSTVKRKKPVTKYHVLYDSIWMKYPEESIYSDRK